MANADLLSSPITRWRPPWSIADLRSPLITRQHLLLSIANLWRVAAGDWRTPNVSSTQQWAPAGDQQSLEVGVLSSGGSEGSKTDICKTKIRFEWQ